MANRTISDRSEKTVTIRFSGSSIQGGSVLIEDTDGGGRTIDYTLSQAAAIGTSTNRTNTVAYLQALIADALTRAGFA